MTSYEKLIFLGRHSMRGVEGSRMSRRLLNFRFTVKSCFSNNRAERMSVACTPFELTALALWGHVLQQTSAKRAQFSMGVSLASCAQSKRRPPPPIKAQLAQLRFFAPIAPTDHACALDSHLDETRHQRTNFLTRPSAAGHSETAGKGITTSQASEEVRGTFLPRCVDGRNMAISAWQSVACTSTVFCKRTISARSGLANHQVRQ